MTDRPILFSGPMVRALLDGRKTQTRRIMPNHDAIVRHAECFTPIISGCRIYDHAGEEVLSDARFAVSDCLYVREEYYQSGSWAPVEGAVTKGGKQKWAFVPADDRIQFRPQGSFRRAREASDPGTVWLHKRLGRFMPRSASRLTLTVTDVRVERLNACSEADAIAEGLEWVAPGKWSVDRTLPIIGDDPRRVYAELWDHINGAGAWEANPWVVAVSFDVREGNIDG